MPFDIGDLGDISDLNQTLTREAWLALEPEVQPPPSGGTHERVVQELDWRRWANCRKEILNSTSDEAARAHVEQFFPARGGAMARAKLICSACVVRQNCLEFAIENGEKRGVWGGLSERQRRRVRRERRDIREDQGEAAA